MSKTKNKNRSELEYVRGQLKAVRRENRQLRKRNRELEKRSHFYEEVIDDVTEDIDVDVCSECGKGNLEVLDLKHLVIVQCDQCDYKDRRKPDGKKNK